MGKLTVSSRHRTSTVKSTTKTIHPGQIIRLKLQLLGVSISAAARSLRINRTHFSDLVNGHVGISATVAMRLSLGLGVSISVQI